MTTRAKRTTQLTSLLERQWWDVFEVATGRRRTLRDIHDEDMQKAIRYFVDKYLPELRQEIKKGLGDEKQTV